MHLAVDGVRVAVPPETPVNSVRQTLVLSPLDCTTIEAGKFTPLACGLGAPAERTVMVWAAAIRSVATDAANSASAAHENRMKRHRSKALDTFIALSCPAGAPSAPDR